MNYCVKTRGGGEMPESSGRKAEQQFDLPENQINFKTEALVALGRFTADWTG